MPDIEAARLTIPVTTNANKATTQLKGLDKQLDTTKKTTDKFGTAIKAAGGFIGGAAFVGALAAGTKALVQAGSDAEEVGNKFDVVFSSIQDQATAAAESLSDNFGLSSTASKQLLSDTGDLLTGFGFAQESALDLSTQVNELAVDLASFTNFSGGAEGASKALTSALLGEREAVKSLGISILEADVQAKVLENTQAGLTFETERQAKAFATLQIAQEQSKNAIGDFARSQESFANQSRIAGAAVQDLSVELGSALLPVATEAVGLFADVARSFADAAAETNNYRDILNDFKDDGTLDIATASAVELRSALARLESEVETGANAFGLLGDSWDGASKKQLALRDAILEGLDALEKQNIAAGYSAIIAANEQEAIEKRAEADKQAAAERTESALAFALTQQELYTQFLERQEQTAAIEEAERGTREANQAIELEQIRERLQAKIDADSEAIANAQAVAAAEEEINAARLSAFNSFTSGYIELLGLAAGKNKAAAVAYKVLSAAQAGINSYLAFTKTLADGGPFPLNTINAAGVLASGIAQQVKIQQTSFANGTPPLGFRPSPGTIDDTMIAVSSNETVSVSKDGDSGEPLYATIVIDGQSFGKVLTRAFKNQNATINRRSLVTV